MATTSQHTYARRALIVLAVIVVGLGGLLVGAHQWGTAGFGPKLGLDLEGGTQMILTPKVTNGTTASVDQLNQARDIIVQRVDAGGISGAEVTTQGGQNIVVEHPGHARQGHPRRHPEVVGAPVPPRPRPGRGGADPDGVAHPERHLERVPDGHVDVVGRCHVIGPGGLRRPPLVGDEQRREPEQGPHRHQPEPLLDGHPRDHGEPVGHPVGDGHPHAEQHPHRRDERGVGDPGDQGAVRRVELLGPDGPREHRRHQGQAARHVQPGRHDEVHPRARGRRRRPDRQRDRRIPDELGGGRHEHRRDPAVLQERRLRGATRSTARRW